MRIYPWQVKKGITTVVCKYKVRLRSSCAEHDELKFIRQILSFGTKKQWHGILAKCFICVVVMIELQTIIAGIVIYKNGKTWKALLPYSTLIALIQPACASCVIIVKLLPRLENMLDIIAGNTQKSRYQDELFENNVMKESKKMKVICIASIIYSFTAHLLFALPTVFNDYDIAAAYWLIRNYYGTHFSLVMTWMFSALILIGNC
uniref:Uncharacterized protein LOC114328715 n=1 Tax=Diabrotica virgifera virgifera TaxID=50390 RepID=A0A6P7FBY2_DIAVI